MEVGKISEGIQATIDLLDSIPVRGRDLEVQGLALLTAIKNLKILKEATIKAENGELFEGPEGQVKDIQSVHPTEIIEEDHACTE